MRRAGHLLAAAAGTLVLVALSAVLLDHLYPLDFARLNERSTVVSDRNGVPLRVFTTTGGRWRLPVEPEAVSPRYLALLVGIEDKRFWHYPGVDPLALARAAGQLAGRGHVVSGGSTLTMQVVRLLEPRPRTLRSKLVEIARAVQLEAHWSKRDILRAYLALTPMGGNVEGIRAGALAWFGKEPGALSDAEAALLVALPRDPNRLRPDRHGGVAAGAARERVLRRAIAEGMLPADTLASALGSPIPVRRHPMPMLAPHLAEELAAEPGAPTSIATTLDVAMQGAAERVMRDALGQLPRPITVAALVTDWRSGAVLARVGSGDYADPRRAGAVDMVRAVRSPGSTLKPFIYGMAFDGLKAHPGTLVHDAATRFDDYAPHNFDGGFNGDVTIRQALQASLNLPAVTVLRKLGPVVFTERFRAAGLPLDLGSSDAAPGLPIALGGAGTTLAGLVEAYGALPNGGAVVPLHTRPRLEPDIGAPPRLFEAAAADAVADILADMPPPPGSDGRAGRIAYKTGTSYRFRDGWAVGFDGARVAGVWIGRADGGSCACVGVSAAALLFKLFDAMPAAPLPRVALAPFFASPPPPALARLDTEEATNDADRPRITFPVARSQLLAGADAAPVKLAATGGRRPYRWLVDGRPVDARDFAREARWVPAGVGFASVSVIDALGQVDTATVRVVDGTR